jgi:hypothetical protein
VKDLEARVAELEGASQRQLEENGRLKRNLVKLEEENHILKGSNFTFTFPVRYSPSLYTSLDMVHFASVFLVCANGSNLTRRGNKLMGHQTETIRPPYPIAIPSKKPVEQNQTSHFIPPIYQCSISTN